MSFLVSDIPGFEANVLPLYFKTCKVASFVRQLNMYEFDKVPRKFQYRHPYLQRGKHELLDKLARKPEQQPHYMSDAQLAAGKLKATLNSKLNGKNNVGVPSTSMNVASSDQIGLASTSTSNLSSTDSSLPNPNSVHSAANNSSEERVTTDEVIEAITTMLNGNESCNEKSLLDDSNDVHINTTTSAAVAVSTSVPDFVPRLESLHKKDNVVNPRNRSDSITCDKRKRGSLNLPDNAVASTNSLSPVPTRNPKLLEVPSASKESSQRREGKNTTETSPNNEFADREDQTSPIATKKSRTKKAAKSKTSSEVACAKSFEDIPLSSLVVPPRAASLKGRQAIAEAAKASAEFDEYIEVDDAGYSFNDECVIEDAEPEQNQNQRQTKSKRSNSGTMVNVNDYDSCNEDVPLKENRKRRRIRSSSVSTPSSTSYKFMDNSNSHAVESLLAANEALCQRLYALNLEKMQVEEMRKDIEERLHMANSLVQSMMTRFNAANLTGNEGTRRRKLNIDEGISIGVLVDLQDSTSQHASPELQRSQPIVSPLLPLPLCVTTTRQIQQYVIRRQTHGLFY